MPTFSGKSAGKMNHPVCFRPGKVNFFEHARLYAGALTRLSKLGGKSWGGA